MLFKASEILGKPLTLQAGIVRDLQKDIEEIYINNPDDAAVKSNVSPLYIAQFSLGEQLIIAKFQSPFRIHQGDALRVSGVQKKDFFEVVAYRNDTLNIAGSQSWWGSVIAGVSVMLLILLIYLRFLTEPRAIEQIFLLGFFCIGIVLILRGFYIKEAIDLLNPS